MNHYNEYELDDFLNDESFRYWVMGWDNPAADTWTKWVDENPAKRQTLERARRILLSLEPLPAASPMTDEEVNALAGYVHLQILREDKKPVISIFRRTWFRAAVAFLLVGSLYFLYHFDQTSKQDALLAIAERSQEVPAQTGSANITSAGTRPATARPAEIRRQENGFTTLVVGAARRTEVTLADGTRVWLNSGSRLIYPDKFPADNREVYLEGDAYFDVAHNKDSPFRVHAKNMNIQVLGTEFYVSTNSTAKSSYAVLVRGSIAFSAGSWFNRVEQRLVSGQQIDYNPETSKFSVSAVGTAEFESWKNGFVNLKSASLADIIRQIEKYYNLTIDTHGLDLSAETFSGRLDFQNSADDVVRFLCEGTPFRYNEAERRLEPR